MLGLVLAGRSSVPCFCNEMLTLSSSGSLVLEDGLTPWVVGSRIGNNRGAACFFTVGRPRFSIHLCTVVVGLQPEAGACIEIECSVCRQPKNHKNLGLQHAEA